MLDRSCRGKARARASCTEANHPFITSDLRPMFKKGQSGNPGGRPKEIRELKEIAQSHGAAMIEALVKIAKTGKSESARVTAATVLLERGFGKPLQQIETGQPGEFEALDRDQLREFVEREAAELGLGKTLN